MFKGTLILVLAYVAAVSCAIIPVAKPGAETELHGCNDSIGDGSSTENVIIWC